MNSTGQQPIQPFGYAFYQPEPISSEPTAILSASAAGPSLLDQNESGYLNNFFTFQGLQDPSGPAFDIQNLQTQGQAQGGADLSNYNWMMNEPPPTFMGASATPKPPPPSPSQQYHLLSLGGNYDLNFADNADLMGASQHGLPQANNTGLNTTAGSQAQSSQMSGQTMDAASGLLESIEMFRTSNVLPTAETLAAFAARGSEAAIPAVISQLAQHQQQQMFGSRPLHHLDGMQIVSFDGPHSAPARRDAPSDPGRYYKFRPEFGSDVAFADGKFVPGPEVEPEEVVAHRMTEELLRLKPINRSVDSSRQATPEPKSAASRRGRPGRESDSSEDEDTNKSTTRKRRIDGSEEEPSGSKTKTSARRTSNFPGSRRVSSVETGTKRRCSSLAGSASKQSRENLTEEQKRSNHIQSEQKRRNLIKQGFADLHVLVPELRSGGLSKSMVLTEAANFLEQLQLQNAILQHRLSSHDGG